MNIGHKLRVSREGSGYTLRQVSAQAEIGESTLSDLENSKREPKFSQLSRLADIYKRPIEFFLMDDIPGENVMLWRDTPSTEDEKKKTEAEFRQLCEQYHRLEVLMGEAKKPKLPGPEVSEPGEFGFQQADNFARKVQNQLCLGDIPSTSLKQVLEENLYVKIFHLDFAGSAISTKSEEFGSAILLNRNNRLWRRNYDLAHELFHVLTWDIFRKAPLSANKPSEFEEKLANAFASRLLLPTDSVSERIDQVKGSGTTVTLEQLDEVAREFGVSLDALLWRMLHLYGTPAEKIQKYIQQGSQLKTCRPPRLSDEPDKLPERFCSLAIRALRDGKLSLMQFAKYMGISYKKTQDFLADQEAFTDEKVSISVA